MTKSPNYITPQGLETLREEYRRLLREERPKVVETVAWAAGNGDRSENGDYIYGKKRLREIDRRLRFLNQRIESAQVVDPKTVNSNKIVFGATVSLENEAGEHKTYQIVGEDEIDPQQGLISWRSPLARALLGKSPGDEIQVRTRNGEIWYEITSIRFG